MTFVRKLILVAPLAVSYGAMASSRDHSLRVVNAIGTQVSRVEVRRDQLIVADRQVPIQLGEFRLLDDDKSSGPSEDSVEGEVLGCSIGGTPLPDSAVRLDLRNRSSLSTSEAEQSFPVTLRIDVPQKSSGLFSCAVIRLYTSRNRRTLTDFGLAAQLVPRPEWQDTAGRVIQGVNLDFSGVSGVTNQPRDVGSKTTQVRLINALSDCACLHFVGPQLCSIGANNVADGDIRLEVNRRSVKPGACVSVNSSTSISVSLVFDKAGFYNRFNGAVSCKQQGQFVYSY